jgi:toxin ParE1/3/4
VAKAVGRVKTPRHFLVYRLATPECIEVGRVLHDSMDLTRHLPHDFQPFDPEP